jgi:hypothetical protein
MKLYIDGPDNKGEGAYSILTEEGEFLASHYCTNSNYARGDLESRREERQKEWKERFGDYQVLMLGEDSMTRSELMQRNHKFHEEHPNE